MVAAHPTCKARVLNGHGDGLALAKQLEIRRRRARGNERAPSLGLLRRLFQSSPGPELSLCQQLGEQAKAESVLKHGRADEILAKFHGTKETRGLAKRREAVLARLVPGGDCINSTHLEAQRGSADDAAARLASMA